MVNETATVEEQKNCLGCNKPLHKAKKYYRNGKYFCNKGCWKKAEDKRKAEAAEANKE